MPRQSAGLLVYRLLGEQEIEVLLAHPGGPFFARKDLGVWSVPKGEHEPEDDPLTNARREFEEEIGQPAPEGAVVDLGEIRQKSGKVVRAFVVRGDLDVRAVQSNTFELEWPRGSGKQQLFPEVDRASWCKPEIARAKLNPAQIPLLERLLDELGLG